MSEKLYQPGEYDAVLGGQAATPVNGVVLGGIEGVKSRLASAVDRARVAALTEALKYGDAGLDLVIAAINDADRQVQRSAYLLLRERTEPQVEQALREYRIENLRFERLERYRGYSGLHVTTFANRKVENFDPQTGINDTVGTAYFLGVDSDEDENDITNHLETLLQDARVGQVEALVFGRWNEAYDNSSKFLIDALVAAKDRLSNLKAIFIGDIVSTECDISSIQQSDISPVLEAYPNLEVLQVRGSDGLAFSPVRHNKLEALIVETEGLNRETIAQICALSLPVLEHLELWLGRNEYGGDSSSDYSDAIAEAIVNSPLIERLKVLDLSMGNLTDKGAKALLKVECRRAINRLHILNVSNNYLSTSMIQRLSKLKCGVISEGQEDEDDRYHQDEDDEDDRYSPTRE